MDGVQGSTMVFSCRVCGVAERKSELIYHVDGLVHSLILTSRDSSSEQLECVTSIMWSYTSIK